MDQHNFRKYRPDDCSEVIQLFRLNTPEYFAPEEEKDLVYYLNNHSENFFLVEEKNLILGCGGFNLSEDGTVGKISWDFFHPEQQGKGLGTMLTKFRIEKLRENPQVKIISVRTSQLAHKFYERFGFKLQEIIKDFWAPGFDMYRMEFSVAEM